LAVETNVPDQTEYYQTSEYQGSEDDVTDVVNQTTNYVDNEDMDCYSTMK